MKRLTVCALLLCLCLGATGADAQSQAEESLEQSYARLCADGQQGEACEVLRSALLKKLSGGSATTAGSAGSGSATSRATPSRATPSAAASVSPRWGLWAELPGTAWLADNGTLISYSWEKKGEVLATEVFTANMAYSAVTTLSPSGSNLDLKIGKTAYTLQPQADGSFLQATSDKQRTRYTLSADQMVLAFEILTEAGWVAGQWAPITRRRLQASEISGHKATLAQRRQEFEAMIAREWGIIPRLIDQKFLSTNSDYPQFNAVITVTWADRGADALLAWNYLSTGKLMGWHRLTRDAATGRIEARNESGLRGDVSMTTDGRVRIAWDPTPESRGYGALMGDYYIAGGRLHSEGYFMKNGRKRNSTVTSYATVTGKSNESLRTAVAQQATQQAAQARPAKKSGGGFLGVVQGAIGGVTGVANAGGGLSEAVVGGAVGAVAGGAGVDAGTISASTATLVQGSPTGAAVTSGGAARAAGAGSYPTRPNALNGQPACSMMNESNYRQVSESGGNDVQLKTMCGLAYEHYVSYKRAIAQGYSEADANRTYAAHQQAARVAIRFYADTRTR